MFADEVEFLLDNQHAAAAVDWAAVAEHSGHVTGVKCVSSALPGVALRAMAMPAISMFRISTALPRAFRSANNCAGCAASTQRDIGVERSQRAYFKGSYFMTDSN